jgi:hypothetical protein
MRIILREVHIPDADVQRFKSEYDAWRKSGNVDGEFKWEENGRTKTLAFALIELAETAPAVDFCTVPLSERYASVKMQR